MGAHDQAKGASDRASLGHDQTKVAGKRGSLCRERASVAPSRGEHLEHRRKVGRELRRGAGTLAKEARELSKRPSEGAAGFGCRTSLVDERAPTVHDLAKGARSFGKRPHDRTEESRQRPEVVRVRRGGTGLRAKEARAQATGLRYGPSVHGPGET